MTAPFAIAVENLSVSYGTTPVLWDLHFQLPKGKLIAVIGPNGAGKSTLMKSLVGIVRPLSGSVSFFGKSLAEMRSEVAYIPQKSELDWDFPLTLLELVLMGRYGRVSSFKWLSREDKRRALQALEEVGLLPYAGRQISALSGGQQQRAFLARALVQEAEIYLMDEAFAGVDVASEQAISSHFRKLKEQGKTIVVVHHDLDTVERLFDLALLLNTSLIALGDVKSVLTDEHLFRAYGKGAVPLDEATRLSVRRHLGLS